jgi:uncharacterized protein (TIGR01440 family)
MTDNVTLIFCAKAEADIKMELVKQKGVIRMDLKEIREQSAQAAHEISEAAHLKKGEIFVVGCSSSEVLGEKIGTHTSVETAYAIYEGIMQVLEPAGIALAAQCCEHLNRALVVERKTAEKYDFEQVNAIPQPNHAGGAFATIAYQRMKDPVLVESINARASAGIDIGGTLIGMHIHPVVVPLRISLKKIGEADIICARRRPKYVGGQRAVYDPDLM